MVCSLSDACALSNQCAVFHLFMAVPDQRDKCCWVLQAAGLYTSAAAAAAARFGALVAPTMLAPLHAQLTKERLPYLLTVSCCLRLQQASRQHGPCHKPGHMAAGACAGRLRNPGTQRLPVLLQQLP